MRRIFDRYLALGSVHKLQSELNNAGVRSKQRMTASGRTVGGLPFSRGALFHLLANRLYLGKITHKGAVYPGAHGAIVDEVLFERVQVLIAGNRRRRPDTGGKVAAALLTGKIVDAGGAAMSPSFSYGKSGRVYRYYVTSTLQQGSMRADGLVRRVPAAALEALVQSHMALALPSLPDPISHLRRLQVLPDRIELALPAGPCARSWPPSCHRM